MDLSAASKAID
jgi:hypothetical protein